MAWWRAGKKWTSFTSGTARCLLHSLPTQQLHAARVAVLFGLAGVPRRRGIVCAHRVNLGERHVRAGAGVVEPNRFQQQRQRFILLLLDAVELRQVVPGPRIPRLARDPFLLFANVRRGFAIQREIDHLFAPEAHGCSPTRIRRTSITLVLVGPVTLRSPKPSKYRCESLSALNPGARGLRVSVRPSPMAPAASVGPSLPSVPALSTTTFSRPAISMAADSTNS